MYHSSNILQILKENNISAYKISKETGISESLFSKWKKNPTSEISSINLTKIADYLDCSVGYLLGRTDNPNSHKILKETKISVEQHKKDIPKNVSITAEELIESSKNNIKNIKKEDL